MACLLPSLSLAQLCSNLSMQGHCAESLPLWPSPPQHTPLWIECQAHPVMLEQAAQPVTLPCLMRVPWVP